MHILKDKLGLVLDGLKALDLGLDSRLLKGRDQIRLLHGALMGTEWGWVSG